MSAASEIFKALDPILMQDWDSDGERTMITVRTDALHDLMTAYQIARLSEAL